MGYPSLAKARTVLITGASAGLGRALAEEFQSRGYEILATGRDLDALQSLGAAACYAVDLSRPDGSRELYDQVTTSGHRVDILVCNAGVGLSGPFLDQGEDALRALVEVNIQSLTALNRLFLPQMAAQGGGGVMNIASTGAWQPGPYMAAYYASKSYVLSLTRAVRQELSGAGVTATAVCPGAIATGFSQKAGRRNPKNAMPPRTVARAAVQGFLRGRGLVVPGFGNKCGHLATKLLPAPWCAWAVGQYQKRLNGGG